MSKSIKIILIALIVMVSVSALSTAAYAIIPYKTYSYLYDKTEVITPDAYVPKQILTSRSIGIDDFKQPEDLFISSKGYLYISDTGNNRIIVLNSEFKLDRIIAGFDNKKVEDKFNMPRGLFITDKDEMYIADSENGRIVVLDKDDNLIKIIGRPVTSLISKETPYKPVAVAVGMFNRVFVVGDSINLGVLEFNEDGGFDGFSGAQKVAYSAIDYLWKQFLTPEQVSRMGNYIPTEYTNITTDDNGFYFVVSDKIDPQDIISAISSRSKDSKGAPIKKYNHSGFDILKRNGYFPPVGNIKVVLNESGEYGLSSIVDVALGETGTYSLLDYSQNRIFTYSENGELLFRFSGKSSQIGNSLAPVAIDYKGSELIELDSLLGRITVFSRTAYGDGIMRALDLYSKYKFDESIEEWNKILQDNPNFDLAYDGIGRAYMNQEKYKDAMTCFAYSNNMAQYSDAFKGYRKQLVSDFMLFALIGIVLLILSIYFFSKFIKTANTVKYKTGKYKLLYQMTYGFYLILHPFDGFWDLKHEKRGSAYSATALLTIAFIVSIARKVMVARLFNSTYNENIDIIMELIRTIGIVILFVVANWCLTTLMDGEGSLKDIYIAVGYAIYPMILTNLVVIPMSYIFTLNEGAYIGLIDSTGVIWTVFLVFIGITVVHQYTTLKTAITCFLSIIGMAIITAIILLFTTTIGKIIEFLKVIVLELLR